MDADLTAIIACRGAVLPSIDALRDSLERIVAGARIEEVLTSTGDAVPGSQGRVLKVNGLTFALLGVAAPLPLEALIYGPVPTLFWPTAEQDLAGHSAHVRVMVMDGDGDVPPTIERARALVHLTAALCTTIDAIGVLWCPADHLMSAARFVQIATTPESAGQMLATIFARLLANQTPRGVVVATHGLTALTGGPELELGPTTMLDLVTLATRAMQFAEFVLNGLLVLKPGDIVGPENFSVASASGSFDGRPVLRLMPTATN